MERYRGLGHWVQANPGGGLGIEAGMDVARPTHLAATEREEEDDMRSPVQCRRGRQDSRGASFVYGCETTAAQSAGVGRGHFRGGAGAVS